MNLPSSPEEWAAYIITNPEHDILDVRAMAIHGCLWCNLGPKIQDAEVYHLFCWVIVNQDWLIQVGEIDEPVSRDGEWYVKTYTSRLIDGITPGVICIPEISLVSELPDLTVAC